MLWDREKKMETWSFVGRIGFTKQKYMEQWGYHGDIP
jgi:hypothetical protein